MKARFIVAAAGVLVAAGVAVWAVRGSASKEAQGKGPTSSVTASPLFEPGDKPLTILVREVSLGSGKPFLAKETIRESKSRYNQMKQAVLLYLGGVPGKEGRVPSPAGVGLNELYLTEGGEAVVDLSVAQVDRSRIGFHEENLFVRGLVEVLGRNFYEVRRVRILVDGREEPTLFGHYALGTAAD